MKECRGAGVPLRLRGILSPGPGLEWAGDRAAVDKKFHEYFRCIMVSHILHRVFHRAYGLWSHGFSPLSPPPVENPPVRLPPLKFRVSC